MPEGLSFTGHTRSAFIRHCIAPHFCITFRRYRLGPGLIFMPARPTSFSSARHAYAPPKCSQRYATYIFTIKYLIRLFSHIFRHEPFLFELHFSSRILNIDRFRDLTMLSSPRHHDGGDFDFIALFDVVEMSFAAKCVAFVINIFDAIAFRVCCRPARLSPPYLGVSQ